MRQPQPILWDSLAAKFGLSGVSRGSGGFEGFRAKKRRRQGSRKLPRLCTVQLEPLEQRKLLSAVNITENWTEADAGSAGWPANWVASKPSNVNDSIQDQGLYGLQGGVTGAVGASKWTGSGSGVYTVYRTDVTLLNSVQSVSFSSGFGQNMGLVARQNSSANTYYSVQTGNIAGGSPGTKIAIDKTVNGTTTQITNVTVPFGTFAANTWYTLDFFVHADPTHPTTVTDLDAMVFTAGTLAPTAWQITTTDTTTALQNVAGYSGIWYTNAGVNSYTTAYTLANSVSPTINSFTASTASGNRSLTVKFSASGTDADPLSPKPALTSYSLDYGDGTAVKTSNGAMVNVAHTYTLAGSYTPVLTITDSDGQTTTENLPLGPIVVNTKSGDPAKPAITSFTAATNNGSAPLTEHFNATATGSSLNYSLNFGDGVTSTYTSIANVVHTYANAGGYDATLTVIDTADTSANAPGTQAATQNVWIAAVPSAGAITPDAFAATSGTSWSSLPEWLLNSPAGGTIQQIVTDKGETLLTAGKVNSYDNYDNGSFAGNTVNSIQQVTFKGADSNGGGTHFALIARANTNDTTFYAAQTSYTDGGFNALSIVKQVAGENGDAPITLGSIDLSGTLGKFVSGTSYDLKFLVQTDAANSSLTDLKAELWIDGTTAPGWELSITSNESALNGTGINNQGYGGIWELQSISSQGNTIGYASNYVVTTTDPSVINSFTATTTGTFPSEVATFNASATYGGGSVAAYELNYGDNTAPLYQTSAITNVAHTYTVAGSYVATLTVIDSSGGLVQQQQLVTVDAVTTSPNGSLSVDHDGGNGANLNGGDGLVLNFESKGSPYNSSYPLTAYILNFGDGTVINMPVGSGTSTESLDLSHTYTANGFYTATLSLIDSHGDAFQTSQTISYNNTPAHVTTQSFNSTSGILSITFSQDVGAALEDTTDVNGNPTGDALWVDGAAAGGSFLNALDLRNDNSGAGVPLGSSTFSYNAATDTATWNLSSLGLNTTSTSYTARLFSSAIQDQADNNLDGINSGVAGQDFTYHFGAAALNSPVTLATNGVWNTAMPLVFAPTLANSVNTIAVNGGSTKLTFYDTFAVTSVIGNLSQGSTVILEDFPSQFNILNGMYTITKDNGYTIEVTVNSSGINDSAWTAGGSGSLYTPSNRETVLISDLATVITGTAPPNTGTSAIAFTGLSGSHGVYVGTASTFEAAPYNKYFDDTAELGSTGYIVRSDNSNVYIVSNSAQNNAIDAFLQALGVEQYAPDNKAANNNVWLYTPSLPNLSGAWDIRNIPTISFVENDDFGFGVVNGEQTAWDTFLYSNFGGGNPNPNVIQAVPYTFGDLTKHPDWFAEFSDETNGIRSDNASVLTLTPMGTISSGEVFTIVLKDNGNKETMAVTATDSSAADLVTTMITDFSNGNGSQDYFTNLVEIPFTDSWNNNPALEVYLPSTVSGTYNVSVSTSNGSATLTINEYHDTQRDYTNPGLIANMISNAVVWAESGSRASGDMYSLSPPDGGGYDQSAQTIALMNSANPYHDSAGDWVGYNANGVYVTADSESYWAAVNDVAAAVAAVAQSRGMTLYVGGLAYSSVSEPPSFNLQPNVFVELSEIFNEDGSTMDQQLKQWAQKGAQTGIYKAWSIYYDDLGVSVPSDEKISTVESNWAMYNNDHVLAIEGESTTDYGAAGLGYFLADQESDNVGINVASTLDNFYSNSFGPTSAVETDMEDYFSLFNGSQAAPALSSWPNGGVAQHFNGFSDKQSDVNSDHAILQQAFSYLDSADSDLSTAYNGGHGTITLAQYNAVNNRIDQMRLYDVWLYYNYQLEADTVALGYDSNNPPPLNGTIFNTLLGDLTNLTSWTDDITYTDLVDTNAFMVEFDSSYTYHEYQSIWNHDPNGNAGLAGWELGLRNVPGQNPDPTQIALNQLYGTNGMTNVWSIADAIVQVPVPPSNLTAYGMSTPAIDLSWTNHSPLGTTNIDIWRGTSTDTSTYTEIASTVSGSATTYNDTSVTAGTNYYYEIEAQNTTKGTMSDFSNLVEGNSTNPLLAPFVTAAKDVTFPTSEIDLTWTSNSPTATLFNVYYGTSTDTATFTNLTTVKSTFTQPMQALTASATGLVNGTTYYYYVVAQDANGNTSADSVTASATTDLISPDWTSDQNDGAVAESPTQIDLTWSDNDSGVANEYTIWRSTDDSNFVALPTTVGANATTYNDTGLTPNTNYYYEIQASNTLNSSTSALSHSIQATTFTITPAPLATDYFYGTNGSAWSSQWTVVNALTHATAALTIQNGSGQAQFTQAGTHVMGGSYTALNNITSTSNYVDSYQTVLFESDTTGTNFQLIARSNTQNTTYYYVHVGLSTVSTNSLLGISRSNGGNANDIKKISVGAILTNTLYELEFEVLTSGNKTLLDAKLWAVSTTEPTTWNIATNDNNATLQGMVGSDGMIFTPAGSAPTTNTFTVDNYEAIDIAAGLNSNLENFEGTSPTADWTPQGTVPWTTGIDGDSIRYYINSSSYSAGSGSTLGALSLFNASYYGDFNITADMKSTNTSGANANYAIVFGYQDSSDYYFMLFSGVSGSTALYHVSGGAATMMGSAASGAWIADTDYHSIQIMRTTVAGSATISVWFDGAPVLSGVADPLNLPGQIGFGALQNNQAYFDNLIAGSNT